MSLNDKLIEDAQNLMSNINKLVGDALNSPLTSGQMDKATHDEFIKDLAKHMELKKAGRNTEADAFVEKMKLKYAKKDV